MLDEMKLTAEIEALKETVIFLVEQERIRGEAMKALDEKVEALKEFVDETIIKPSVNAYHEEMYNDFNGKYGERLGQYNELLQKAYGDPEYDIVRETYDSYNNLPDEKRVGVTEESFVGVIEDQLKAYIADIKQSLGIPAESPIKIEDDGKGTTTVEADVNGDGEITPDENVVDSVEETAPAVEDDSDYLMKKYGNIDLDLARRLEEWSKK